MKSLLFGLALGAIVLPVAGAAPAVSDIGFGVRVGPAKWQALEAAARDLPTDPKNALHVTLDLPVLWAAQPDWLAFDAVVRSVLAAHAELTVATQIPAPLDDPASVAYLAELSERAGGCSDTLVLSVSLWAQPEKLRSDPDALALAVKRAAIAVRGTGAAGVFMGDLEAADAPLLEALLHRHLRAYVDGFSAGAEGESGAPPAAVSDVLRKEALGAPLLLHLPRFQSPIAAQLSVFLAASRGFNLTDEEPAELPEGWTALIHLRSLITAAMGVQATSEVSAIEDASGSRPDVGAIGLLDPDRMIQGLLLVPNVPDSRPGLITVRLPTTDITGPRVCPLPAGDCAKLAQASTSAKPETVLKVPWEGRALLVLCDRLKTGTVGAERLSVSAPYRTPVDVIVARHQAVQQAQDFHLANWRAGARVEYDFNLPGGAGDLPVTFLNTYFYERGSPIRWVQDKLLIGGVAWKGRIPELPTLDPEEANVPPLALTLTSQYAYRDLGDAKVGERECYEIGFEPLPASTGRLFPGKAWIDKRDYVLLRLNVKQTNLEEPQVSNDETQSFAPFKGPGGRTYWLVSKVEAHQIFAIGPVTLVASRTVVFEAPVVNDPEFDEALSRAETGDSPILQETEHGFRYLEKKDGERVLRAGPKRSYLLGQAGFYYDRSYGSPLPLVGINYFNYDWLGTKSQIVLFAAGAVNSATLSKVNVLPDVDLYSQANLFAVPYQDMIYSSGIEDRSQRIKILQERVVGSLGWRFSAVSKLSLNLSFTYDHYAKAGGTSPLFHLPKDNLDSGVGLAYTVSGKGWSAVAECETHARSAWEDWGLSTSPKEAAGHKRYSLWDTSVGKTFSLPGSQKVGASLAWMDGKDLDRFSRYQFSYLGRQSLAGFAGSGVRFDRGAIASLVYNFNLANIVRFDLRLNRARVEPGGESGVRQRHTGMGLRAAVGGPWQTYWTLDVGYAIQSDIAPVVHQKTVALVIWKLF